MLTPNTEADRHEASFTTHNDAADICLSKADEQRGLALRNSGRSHPGQDRARCTASRAWTAAADAHFAAADAHCAAENCNRDAERFDIETSELADQASLLARAAEAAAFRATESAEGPNARPEDIGWVGDEADAEGAALEAAMRASEASEAATVCEQGR